MTKCRRAPQEVIDWINEGRKILGLLPLDDLPKGLPGVSRRCPIAKALTGSGYSIRVGCYTLAVEDGMRGSLVVIDLPEVVFQFRQDFDSGKYPQLCDLSEMGGVNYEFVRNHPNNVSK